MRNKGTDYEIDRLILPRFRQFMCYFVVCPFISLFAWNTWAEQPRGFQAIKSYVKTPLVEALGKQDFSEKSPIVLLAGWDFDKKEWRINELANQMVHMAIGGIINRLWGRHVTLCVALGVEIEQLVVNDNYDPKLADRVRDVAFYLLG